MNGFLEILVRFIGNKICHYTTWEQNKAKNVKNSKTLEKAIQLHTRKGQCKREFHSSTSTTTTTTTSNPALHSDDCFLELANYVLEGTALGE